MAEAPPELCFVPLGGAGEIGMNLNLYGFGPPDDEDWVMVDLGITFGSGAPGIDVILPDPAFIEERRDRLLGLVLTHAHEDHLGAVPYLWPRLRCPVYATPFTASVLRRKLAEVELLDAVPIHEVPLKGRFAIGPFDMGLITLTHSIPEPNGIAIRTPAGTVLHTGDWKFDPDPVIGEAADEDALRRLGDEGVMAIVCDSTNVFSPGDSGSEADLLPSLSELIGQCEGRVAVACFATNVARLETIARAAAANDRDVVLARIAAAEHPRVELETGDTVIFSSREIPGNEYAIGKLQNMLIRRGIQVITPRDHFVHVSGHPARDELTRMYQLARPRVSVPVHGELRHLVEHAALARTCQVSHAVVAENGSVVRLNADAPGVIDHVPAGRLALEGRRVVPIQGELVRERSRALFNGTAFVTVVVDTAGDLIGEPQLAT